MKTTPIDRPLIENMAKKSSVSTLCDSGTIKDIVFYKNNPYIITGFASSGEKGLLWVDAFSIEPLEFYDGPLIPMNRWEHQDLVDQGKRERGYPGQIATFDSVKYVITEEHIKFTPVESGVQLEMFQL